MKRCHAMRKRPGRFWAVYLGAGLASLFLLVGCSEDDPAGPDPRSTAAELTEQGWTQFEQGDLAGALSSFDDAIEVYSSYGPAYVGQGWTYLAQGASNSDFESALSSYDTAISEGEEGAEILGGRAAANLALSGESSLDAAVTDAQSARVWDSNFIFEHRTSFNASDLFLIESFALAAQGYFPAALAAADSVETSGIQEASSATWVVDSQEFTSFAEAVLAHLMKVSEQESG
ncbi:MAG: hypothetical protein KAY24_14750 [Candidatus Eisenbacteria sp.]|nr:hypothetical protein [Candidatus Eisenbacteria bacterium]